MLEKLEYNLLPLSVAFHWFCNASTTIELISETFSAGLCRILINLSWSFFFSQYIAPNFLIWRWRGEQSVRPGEPQLK